ncbi:MAG: energy transducer TonB [Oricola sp.]
MRRRELLRIAVATVASLGVHFAAAMVAAPSAPPVLVEGGATAEIAMLGSSFEDLLQGSDRLQPVEPVVAEPVEVELVKAAATEPTRAALPSRALQVTTEPVADHAGIRPVVPDVLTGAVPVMVQPAEETEPAIAPATRTVTAKPVETVALAPVHAAATVRAEPETPLLPVPLARPAQPADERELARGREAQKKSERIRVASVARGNADRNARTGKLQGRAVSAARVGGSDRGGNAKTAGNAKASNYPGKVYAKIRRTRQNRAGGTGVARIRFSIAANGALASVRVVASSGSAQVDSIAVDHIRRSAPFPPPPAGAQRQFVIPVEVRR